jgi:hypothetical protein
MTNDRATLPNSKFGARIPQFVTHSRSTCHDSERLGHANISQTSKYLATTTPGEHEPMRRFEAHRPIDTAGVTPSPSAHVDHTEIGNSLQ